MVSGESGDDSRSFGQLRESSVGLRGALFQSITGSGLFKGMVFGVLAFGGFEVAAPFGEVARDPKWTIPRAVLIAPLAMGAFYLLGIYGWIAGTGTTGFVAQATSGGNPWLHLGRVWWGEGWPLILPVAAIVLFAFALYYQYSPLPAAPLVVGNWVALEWMGAGLVALAAAWWRLPDALARARRIFVDEGQQQPSGTGREPLVTAGIGAQDV